LFSPGKQNSTLIARIQIGLQRPIENGLEMPTATEVSKIIVRHDASELQYPELNTTFTKGVTKSADYNCSIVGTHAASGSGLLVRSWMTFFTQPGVRRHRDRHDEAGGAPIVISLRRACDFEARSALPQRPTAPYICG
jgi:hypothetical protein